MLISSFRPDSVIHQLSGHIIFFKELAIETLNKQWKSANLYKETGNMLLAFTRKLDQIVGL